MFGFSLIDERKAEHFFDLFAKKLFFVREGLAFLSDFV